MGSDLALVIGILMLLACFPLVVSSFSAGEGFGRVITVAVVGCVLIVMAESTNPSGYRPDQVPQAFLRVIGYFTR